MGKFIAFSDDNGFTIDVHTELPFMEDVAKRHEAEASRGSRCRTATRKWT